MKHNFSFLPSLRRTTLLALLCLGIMPVLAETVYTIKFREKDGQRVLCMKDMGDGVVQYVKNDATDASKWRKISCGGDLVYLQNVSTKRYLCCGTTKYGGGDWYYYTTSTTETYEDAANYKWYFADNGVFSAVTAEGSGSDKTYHLHSCNQYDNMVDGYSPKPNIPCGVSKGNYNDYCKVDVAESTITSSYTFPAGSEWYLDMRTITSNWVKFLVDFGDKYSVTQTISGSANYTGYNSGEFNNCNKPFLQITFSADAVVDENKIVFRSDKGGVDIKNNFPDAGQNMMVVSEDGKSITWGTYVPGPTCTDCGLVNAKQ